MKQKRSTNEKIVIERLLGYIFSRPILAAVIIGSLIHIGKWINYSLHGVDYLQFVSDQLSDNVALGFVDILMSYIVPGLVVTVSRKLAIFKEKEFYQNFPELNPDIIIKCAKDGSPEYINSTAQTLMHELKISLNEVALLLPNEICSLVVDQNKMPQRLTHEIKGRIIEYSVSLSDDGLVFLSGRQAIDKID